MTNLPTPTIFLSTSDILHHNIIVCPAEDPVLQQSTFLSSGQLALTGGAGETGQVEGDASRSTHPVARVDVTATAGTAGPIPPEEKKKMSDICYVELSVQQRN